MSRFDSPALILSILEMFPFGVSYIAHHLGRYMHQTVFQEEA